MTIPAPRIRMLAAALIAALAVALATASFAPDAQAGKNTGRFKQSGEAVKLEKLSRDQTCGALQNSYQNLTDLAQSQFEEGNLAGSSNADANASEAKRTAGHLGCSWAQ